MKEKRFSEERIIGVLKEAETGLPVLDLLRKHGIAHGASYRRKDKFGDLEISDTKWFKAREDENRHFKRLVAEQTLDIQALRYVSSKKW